MEVLYQVEERDGLRWSWNIWPSSRIDASRMVVPLAAMYQPLKKGDSLVRVYYEPVQCKGPCKSYLNPFWYVVAYVGLIFLCALAIVLLYNVDCTHAWCLCQVFVQARSALQSTRILCFIPTSHVLLIPTAWSM